jgi:tetratricopeptide (TPR) repeat protein
MSTPFDFTFYNPDRLDDQAFLAGFVARQDLADKILARLGEIKPRGLAQHRLIVGQRGMGKTSLLRRIALGVRDEPVLATVLLPLSFREEQYNVHNLHVFWCNCLDALGDWLDAAGRAEDAKRLDREVAALNSQEDDEEGSRALELFKGWMKKEQRRPLLLLDNLDIIFAGLKSKQWSLRRVLQEAGGIVVIGASAGALEAAADRESAFYDFFQVDVLTKLAHHEILLCLRNMARQREEAGRRVLQILDSDPARIHVLYDLTGGNPRTLAFLYLVLETGGDDDVMRDLERLLDQATPLYKARVEELAPQTRVVFDALALAWDPTTAADLAGVTGLDVSAVSVQLDRLVKEGVVEKAGLSSTRRTGFQVAERFFNIWYLMRHSSRRQRLRLRWLTEMLRRIYSPQELRERAMGLLRGPEGQRPSSSAYCIALGDAVEDRELRTALLSGEGDAPLEDDFPLSGFVPEPVRAEEAAATYRRAIDLNPSDPGLWCGLGWLLLNSLDSQVEAEAAYRKAIEIAPKYALPWNALGWLLTHSLGRHAEAETAYRKAIELDPEFALPWHNLGDLVFRLGRYSEAEAAYRKAIYLDPTFAWSWHNLGDLLAHIHGRNAQAEAAYRKAIEIDPGDPILCFNFGALLSSLGRYGEAEVAYRKAIEIDPKFALGWTELCHLLWGMGRYVDAEAVYRKALQILPNFALWNQLASLLAGPLGCYMEAEAAYRKAIEINPKDSQTWNHLGNLLADHLFHFDEAERAYSKALKIEPQEPAALYNLACLLLRRDGRENDAETIYRKAIVAVPPHGAGLLRAFHSLAMDNFGTATAELGAVLEENHPGLFIVFRIGLLRVLQFAAERGHGDRLLAWLKSSGFSDRYWPLYAAFDAYLHGEGRLMDVNPEVRSGARRLLAEMTRWPSELPPPEPGKKTRRKRRTA